MQAAQRIIAVTLFAAVSATAVAQENPDLWAPEPMSTKSRAQVQAELEQARSDGSINVMSTNYDLIASEPTAGMKSRTQVRAELQQAIASGEFERLRSETSSFFFLPTLAGDAKRGG